MLLVLFNLYNYTVNFGECQRLSKEVGETYPLTCHVKTTQGAQPSDKAQQLHIISPGGRCWYDGSIRFLTTILGPNSYSNTSM